MRITTQKQFVDMVGEKAVQKYKVSINPALMAALSGLYQNVPWAIVREYGTNMYDGYIRLPANAERRPPELHVPNALEPYIEFKDFGCGMSFETVWEVFTSYGLSTKWDNDDEVGGLGFGSKAAFCYDGCDSWTVESRFNGERMIFSACKDAEGNPNLVHLDTVKTEDPNGVTIKIPVARKDMDRFREEIKRFVMYYPMEIKVVGLGEEVPEIKYALKGDDWGVLKQQKNPHGYVTSGQKIQVVMGNVPYPVDTSLAQGHKPDKSVPQYSYNRQGQSIPGLPSSLDIFAPVGTFDIVPSREGLMYNDRTMKALNRVFSRIKTEIPFKVDEEVADQPTLWAKVKRAHELYGAVGMSVSHRNNHLQAVKIPFEGLLSGEEELIFLSNRNNTIEISTKSLNNKDFLTFDPNNNNVVYIEDLKKGPIMTSIRADMIRRIKDPNNRGRYAYDSVRAYVIRNTTRTKDEWQKVLLGFDDIVFVSEINVGTRNTKTEIQISSRRIVKWSGNDVGVRTHTTTINPNDGAPRYFIRAFNNNPSEMGNVDEVLKALAKRGHLVPDVDEVFILNRQFDRFETRTGWVDFVAKFKPLVEKDVYSHREEICNDDHRVRLTHRVFDIIRSDRYRFVDPLVVQLRKYALDFLRPTSREILELKVLAQGFRIDYNSDSPIEKAVKDLFAKYPMLNVVGDWNHTDTIAKYMTGESVATAAGTHGSTAHSA